MIQETPGLKNFGDVTKIDETKLPDFDILTGGFPCQSFSIAGKREGFAAANKGKLFFDIIRIAEYKMPKFMLLENVEGLLSHDDGNTMKIILSELKRIGYLVKWKKLYSKNLGTPQNRPRVWFVCFREQDDYNKFLFPEKEKLKIAVKDLLEDEVDEKYYLTEKQLKKINMNIEKNIEKNRGFGNKPQNIDSFSTTLTSHMMKDKTDVPYFKIADFRYDEGVRIRKDGLCPTLASGNTGSGLSGQPLIYNTAHTKANGKRWKDDGCCFTLEATENQSLCVNSNDIQIISSMQEHNTSKNSNIMNTLPSAMGLGGGHTPMILKQRWRRLTPRECFRLQGFFEDQIKFGDLRNSKLYFLAGNGWDINVANKILKCMFTPEKVKRRLNHYFL